MSDDFERDGYSVHEAVLDAALCPDVIAAFDLLQSSQHGAGKRIGLAEPGIAALAQSQAVRSLVTPVLGGDAFAFRATLFDKTPESNWPVAWHQDRVVPVVQRESADGFAQWSQKEDGLYVEPPRTVQERIVAVRVDVDGSGPHHGGLQVVAGSHRGGVFDPLQIAAAVAAGEVVCPNVVAGGAMRMRPLLLHRSARLPTSHPMSLGHRRIVHFEFFSGELPGGVHFVRRVGGGGE